VWCFFISKKGDSFLGGKDDVEIYFGKGLRHNNNLKGVYAPTGQYLIAQGNTLGSRSSVLCLLRVLP
ncbi:MAG: hypothetical protein D3910_04925, partial [Candidatus Electrothrix sp. ATG2]|nr:hypothetical protein [Candidatus Electrothrix sp. ATG2]